VRAVAERPIAVEVENLHKAFRIPTQRVETLKERALHLFRPAEYTTLQALRGVSFQVAEGEFLGVVGRNGSGKTTLLKLLASIYRADRGRIRVAGALAPFIELGVGFNPNLTARENVLLNGVMMGLTPREGRRRFDEVIEFAELEDFVEMKLKNYSSGMSMRLAFAVMVQAEADVMLVDEVLAVGDASFAHKCADAFQRMRDEGRTILFVTHDMESLRSQCDRAILIDDGVIDRAGDPTEVAYRYLQINFAGLAGAPPADTDGAPRGIPGRIAEVWLENADGERPRSFEHGSPVHLTARIEARERIDYPVFAFEICAADGTRVFGAPAALAEHTGSLEAGETVTFRAALSNPLTPGSYVVNCSLSRRGVDLIDLRRPAAELKVWGEHRFGYVELEWDCQVERTSRAGARGPTRR